MMSSVTERPSKGDDGASSPRERGAPGRMLVIALVASLVVVLGALFWAALTGGSTHVPLSKPGVGFAPDKPEPDAALRDGATRDR